MATIWDADVLIWAASQIVEAENLGFKTSRFLRLHALPAADLHWPPDRGSRLQAAEGRARPPAVDRHPHHHPQRRALAAPPVLLDQRVGGMHDARRPRRGHGVRAARLVLPRRHRPLARAGHRPGLLPADRRHRALAVPRCPQARRPPAQGLAVRDRASPREVRQPGRASRISRSRSGASPRASRCPAIACASSGRAAASCCASCRPTYPQSLWMALWKRSGLRTQTISGLRTQPYRDFARTNRS